MPDYVKKIRTTDDSTEHRLVGSVIPVSPESFGMKAGAALTEGMIVFKSTETSSSSINKIYPITNTSKYVDLNWGLAVVKKACTSGTILNGDYIAQQGVYTYSSATAGRAYGIKLTYDGTGYKMASSTLSTLIVNMSTVTDGYFIYMGIGQVSGSDKIIACDFSNHLFFRFKNNRVVQINGRDVDTLHPSVPVSPDSVGMTTGAAIAAGDIIFRCKTDNKVYPISNTTNYLDLDWGLAIAKEACNANSLLSGNSILQQGPITYASAVNGSVYYLRLAKDSTGYKIYSNTPVTVTETSGHYIYLGHGIVYNGEGSIACDFSNHMFLTLNHGKVTHINGRVLSSSAGDIVVPVSVDSTPPFIGEDLENNLVYKCATDGKLYELDGANKSSKPIDMDWGIAYFPGIVDYDENEDIAPDANTLLQKQEFTGLSSYLPSGVNYDVGEPLFLICGDANPTPRSGAGVFSKGIICSFDDVKLYAENNDTPVTYLYVGTYTDDGYLALDVSNHMFYTFEYPDFKIKAINGIEILQPTIPTIPTYRNPVSGNSPSLIAGTQLTNGCMVFCALYSSAQNTVNKISSTMMNYTIEPEWGLGIYYGVTLTSGNRPAKDTIFQQCEWSGDGADLSSFTDGDDLYALFGLSSNAVGDFYPPIVLSGGLVIKNRTEMLNWAKTNNLDTITYCYIGTLIVSGNTRIIGVDLSSHQFVTEDVAKYKITHINGIAVGGSDDGGSVTDLETVISGCSGVYGLFANSLCCYDTSGEISSFTTSGGTGTSKTSATGLKFPIGNQIYVFLETTSLGGEVDFTAKSFAEQKSDVSLEYTGNLSSNINSGLPVYLHVTVDQATGTFSPAASNLIVDSGGLSSGQYYIFLGWTNETGKSIMFEVNNPLYYCGSGGALVPYYDSVIGNIEDILAAI